MNTIPIDSNGYRVLIVDDNEAIHNDMRKILLGWEVADRELSEDEALLFGQAPLPRTQFEVDSAFQGEEGLAKVQQALAAGRPYALAFVDVRMPPGWDGVETIARLWQAAPDLQVVICTAYSDYSWDKMVRRLGFSENLIILKKPFDNIEVLQLAHALARKWSVTRQAQMRLEDLDRMVNERTNELQTANARLQLSEERFAKAFRASPFPMAVLDTGSRKFVDVNQRFLGITGYSREEVVDRTTAQLRLWKLPFLANRQAAPEQESVGLREFACLFRTRSGETREALVSTELLQLGQGAHLLLILQDVTERVRLESRLRQKQKIEAVGQLAGGIAHDFNNLLAIILGNISLAKMDSPPDSQSHELLKEAESGANRAKELTAQLLTFSKGGKPVKRLVSLEHIIQESARLTLSGPGTRCHLNVADDLWPVEADAAQLTQVFNNLLLNANQAMKGNGEVSVDVINKSMEQGDGRPVRQTRFVQITVEDQGEGIPAENLSRVFDPYFTTRPKGSGLGLAVVYSIVKQHHGCISVESRAGDGARFIITIPACEKTPTNLPAGLPGLEPVVLPGSPRRVLVMDDEELVRASLTKMLARLGCEAATAKDGDSAIQIYQQAAASQNPFDLVIMDLTVPGGMGGQEAIKQIKAIDPTVKALVSSGYSSNPVMSDHKAYGFAGVMLKPYTIDQLKETIQTVMGLDGKPDPGDASSGKNTAG